MELLLWLWFYDIRFFFSLKIPTSFYQMTWLFPILINAFICGFGGYIAICKQITTSLMRILLFSNLTISGVTLLAAIGFIIKISYEHRKHFCNYSEAIKTIPELSLVIKSNDYWVRNNSLNSFFGITLLVCSFVIFAFSVTLIVLRKEWMVPNVKWLYEQNLLVYFSVYELLFSIPVFLEFLLSVFIKVGAFASVYICPGFYSKCSKALNASKRNKTIDFSTVQLAESRKNGNGLLS